jgi:hypothetical protein
MCGYSCAWIWILACYKRKIYITQWLIFLLLQGKYIYPKTVMASVTVCRSTAFSWVSDNTCLTSIFILLSHLRILLSHSPFTSSLKIKTFYKCIFSPIRATCPFYSVLHLIILIICGECHKSWTSSSYSFIQSPVASCFLDRNISRDYISSHILTPSIWHTQTRTPLNILVMYRSVKFGIKPWIQDTTLKT